MLNFATLLPIICLGYVSKVTSALNPIILVPGDGGSQIEARLNKTTVPHYICSKTSDWYLLWLNIEEMIPTIIDCWEENMRLQYDNVTGTTRNAEGVETRIPGFGNTSTVEYIDSSQHSFSIYFATIATELISLGYKRGIDFHGAPYDFRKAANEQSDYFIKLKELIESTYEANGRKPVILICHSMGSIMTLYFLNHQTQAWKDQYIVSYINLSGVWGGTVRAMKVFAVGDDLGSEFITKASLGMEERTNPSLAWLMPSSQFWSTNEVLVQSNSKNYTLNDIEDFYLAFSRPDAYQMYKRVVNLIHELTAPGVETYCLHGKGVPTTNRLIYTEFPGSTPTLAEGDGDGTVNLRSLLGCKRWETQQKQTVHHKVFDKIDHLQILKNSVTSNYVKEIVSSILIKQLTKMNEEPTVDVLH